MSEINKYLQNIYHNAEKVGSFSGPEKLYRIIKSDGKYKISKQKLRQWLNNRDEFSLQRDVKRTFPRRRIITSGINCQWGIDLASTQNISSFNDGVKYLLIAVDVFSRYLHIQPVKSKLAKDVVEAFDSILRKGTIPNTVYSDAGREFNNVVFRKHLQSKHIKFFTTSNQETKVAITERTIRTIRNMLFRMFRYKRSYRFLENLQNIVKNYNSTPHSSLPYNLSPNQVTKSNEAEVADFLYNKIWNKPSQQKASFSYKFQIGDIVRLSYAKYAFQRDYQQKWTGELFKIVDRRMVENIQIYKLVDFMNDPVLGTFYWNELLKVKKSKDSLWLIEKVIKTRKVSGKKQYLVKFQDWPAKFNSWVDESSIEDIKR